MRKKNWGVYGDPSICFVFVLGSAMMVTGVGDMGFGGPPPPPPPQLQLPDET